MAKDFRGRSRRFAAPAGGRSSGNSASRNCASRAARDSRPGKQTRRSLLHSSAARARRRIIRNHHSCRQPFRRRQGRESCDDNQKALWREGLRLVDLMSRHYNGKSFVDASPEDRVAVLTVLSDHDQMTDLPEVRFFLELKRLTVRGYYTSKIGIHDELEYKGNRILQEFVGCDDQGLASS